MTRLLSIISFFITITVVGCSSDPVEIQFRIATYNVEDFGNSGVTDSYNKIASFMKSENINLMALQELQPGSHPADSGEWNYPANNGDAIAFDNAIRDSGIDTTNFVFSDNGGLSGVYGDYLACWSQPQIIEATTILQATYADPISTESFNFASLRPVLRIKIDWQGHIIWLYNLHLKAQSFPFADYPDDIKKRRAQADVLRQFIQTNHNPENDNIIILGDLNTTLAEDFSTASTMDILTFKIDNPANTNNDFIAVNLTELPADSWTHSVYQSRLDHIILSPNLYNNYYVKGSIRVVAHPVNDPSDHYPVVLGLYFN